jgi:hypothetical protein
MTVSRPAPALRHLSIAFALCLVLLSSAFAQEGKAIPQLVKFAGTLTGSNSTNATVVFALYKEASGGAPLWQEVQGVALDASGHYAVLLGAHSSSGIPPELFASGEARWLGVSVQGLPEQARVLLVSVPYAMKASDAETLGGVPASAFVQRSELASPAFVNSAAINSAVKSAVAAAAALTTVAGNIMMYTDTAGTPGASNIFQTSGNVGINTKTPAGTLAMVADNATMRIENYSGSDSGSPNFNFFSANGTAAAPTGTLSGDNLGQFAAAGYIPGTGFPGSKVKINFVSTENWSSTHSGTAIWFSTTPTGTNTRSVQMILDGNGNLGIGNGSNNNPAPTGVPDKLYVAGNIHSNTGYVFPDNTVQTTAARSGVASVAAGDSSVTLGGTATAPTIAVNTATIQKRIANPCPTGQAIASVNSDGSVNCVAVGGGTVAAANNSQYLGLFGPGDGIQDPGEVGGAGARLHTDQAITVTDVTYAPTDPGTGVCTPALARVTNGTIYEDIPIPVPTTTYNTAAHEVVFPANSDISVTLVQAAFCGTDYTSGPPMAFSGSVRYHVTNTGDATVCPPNLTLYNGSCVDTKNDAMNCGTAGNACSTTGNTWATCSNGVCANTRSCMKGYGDCDGNPSNGCETNLTTSAANCGWCGSSCAGTVNNGTSACINSSCQPVCNAGFQQCFGGCTKTASDPNNCGACGNVCGAGQSCSSGSCVGSSGTVGGSTVTVFLTPSSVSLAPGQTVILTAQSSNGSAVAWSVLDGASTCATGTNPNACSYTAPSLPGTYHVVATSSSNSQAKAEATVFVTANTPQPPVFISTPPLTGMPYNTYTYAISATDPLGGSVSFSTFSSGLSVVGNQLTGYLGGGDNSQLNRGSTVDLSVIATSSEGGTASQSWTVSLGGQVTGTDFENFITPTTLTVSAQNPIDLSSANPAALVQNPDGSYATYNGYGDQAGNYGISSVPFGNYWLETFNTDFLLTNANTVDLSYDRISRTGLVPASSGTYLNVSFTGLTTTQSTDMLAFYSPTANVWESDNPTAGLTSWTDNHGWYNTDALLTAADDLYIYQLGARVVGGFNVQTPTTAAGPLHVAMANGATTNLNVTMVAVPSAGTFNMNLKGSTLLAMRSAVNPTIASADPYVDFQVIPGVAYGAVDATGDLLWADFGSGSSLTGDVNLGSLSYNNPFPSSYPIFVAFGDDIMVNYGLTGTTFPAMFLVSNYTATTTLPTATAPLTPLIGPPTAPRINGVSLFTSQTITTTTPTISWSAPTVGTPSTYTVSISYLVASGSSTEAQQVANFTTPHTSLVLPANLLTANGTYVIEISAIYAPGVNFNTGPDHRLFPYAVGQLLSGQITVSAQAAGQRGAPITQAAIKAAGRPLTPLERLQQNLLRKHQSRQKALAAARQQP